MSTKDTREKFLREWSVPKDKMSGYVMATDVQKKTEEISDWWLKEIGERMFKLSDVNRIVQEERSSLSSQLIEKLEGERAKPRELEGLPEYYQGFNHALDRAKEIIKEEIKAEK